MKKTISLVLLLSLLLLVVIFTVQNAEVVQIQFLFWETSLSIAIFMFLLLFLGVLVGILSLLPHIFHLKSLLKKAKTINPQIKTNPNDSKTPIEKIDTT